MSEEKHPEACALCGEKDTDKKWGGQFWHVKCMRKAKRGIKGMF